MLETDATLPDWKTSLNKKAGQIMNSRDLEKVFFDQAYTFIQNAAEPLMKPEFRVGFEIVYNNEENTKMVGIFVFRVGKVLLFVPAFYLNGKIPPFDLLYRSDSKTFAMLDPDWCEYLISFYMPGSGQGVDRSGPHKRTNGSVRFDRMMFPGGSYKQAAQQAWDEMVKSAAESVDLTSKEASAAGSKLRNCMIDLGYESVLMLKRAADKCYALDNALFLQFSPDQYAPEEVLEKKASAELKPKLQVHLNPAVGKFAKQASTEDIRRGFIVEDNREETEKQAVILTAAEKSYTQLTPGRSGKAILADGTTERCQVLSCTSKENTPYSGGDTRHYVLVEIGGKLFVRRAHDKRALPYVADEDTTFKVTEYAEKPKAGKFYILVSADSSHAVGDITYVSEVSGNKVHYSETIYACGCGEKKVYLINKDSPTSSLRTGLIGKDVVFVPVAAKEGDDKYDDGKEVDFLPDNIFADPSELNSMLFNDNFRPVKIKKTQNGYDVVEGMKKKSFFSPQGASLFTAAYYGTDYGTAESLFSEMKQGDTREFRIKAASSLYWDDVPEFTEDYDSTFGVPVDSPQTQVIMANSPEVAETGPRVGDLSKLSDGADIDAIGGVANLDNFAKHVGMRHIFEHGVIGSLLKEFDAGSVVEKYLPDLEKGMDRLGRLLFLIYWSPSDFGRLFGSDDVTPMEQSILSTFKQQGRLLLDLLQKSSGKKTSQTDAG